MRVCQQTNLIKLLSRQATTYFIACTIAVLLLVPNNKKMLSLDKDKYCYYAHIGGLYKEMSTHSQAFLCPKS